jgi:myo-inositol-1(or 4)-monophosphatase
MIDPLEFSTELARQTGKLLVDYFRNDRTVTHVKGDLSVVTRADLASDRLLTTNIHKAYPSDLCISEESPINEQTTELLCERVTWIIDPLDGTTNFSQGLHHWGVLIARLVQGIPEETVLYFPLLEELYYAKKGEGAWLNGDKLNLLDPGNEYPNSFFACCSRTYQQYEVQIPYKTRILGSAAYSFCCVARGAALIGFEATPKIWDIAGCWLLVKEAGGLIDTLNGAQPLPLNNQLDYSTRHFPTLAAQSEKLMKMARKNIQAKAGP